MNFKLLLSIAALSVPCFSYAEESIRPALNPLKPLNNVRVSMQRMLKSAEGRYFLSLYAGVAKPHATLFDLIDNKAIEFKGTQKADQIVMNAAQLDSESTLTQLSGVLNANSGIFQSNLISADESSNRAIQFEPAFKVPNKPLFTFKFYGVKADTQAQEQLLTRVDVINKTNNTVAQSLTGFSAYPKSIGYMDINFDGYYDVVLSDLSQDRKVEDKRYIYWMYNPKTAQYQRSPRLEDIIGFPTLHGEKQQIDFGGGQVYQVTQGLLQKIE